MECQSLLRNNCIDRLEVPHEYMVEFDAIFEPEEPSILSKILGFFCCYNRRTIYDFHEEL